MRNILLTSIFLVVLVSGRSQIKDDEKPTNALTSGMHIHSFGLGFIDISYFKERENRTENFHISFENYKDKKEVRIDPYTDWKDQGGRPYVFDKINQFYVLSASYGWYKDLLKKNRINQIQIKVGISGGLSLGLLKPYYIESVKNAGNNLYVTQSKVYDSDSVQYEEIFGESDFVNGLNEIKPIFGANLRFNVLLDFSNDSHFFRALSSGLKFDYFTKKIPIMDIGDDKQYFMSLYLGFLLGSKY